MSNNVTWSVTLTPENAAKIDAVNRILLGDSYTSVEAKVEATKLEQKAKKSADTAAVQETSTATKTSGDAGVAGNELMTADQFKSAAKKAKRAHDEEFAMKVLKDAGIEVGSSLGRSMSKVNAEQYAGIVASWLAGPQAEPEPEDDGFGEDEEGDGFGEDEDTSEVTVEAVKTALKAFAKDQGRDKASAIMKEHGATALSKVDDCTPDQLKAMFALLVI